MRFLHAYLWVGGCIYLLTKENIDNIFKFFFFERITFLNILCLYMLLTKENIDNIFKYIIILNKARVTGSVSITRLVGQCIIICRG